MVIDKYCVVCEVPFSKEVGPNSKRTKYCSRKCHDTAKRVNTYGITFQEFNEMVRQQNFKCLICERDFTDMISKHITIDHNHDTGEVRGILCLNCNQGLGQFKDNVDYVKAAVRYLEK